MRKALLTPSFNHYLGTLGDEELMIVVLKGHLVIEALMVEIISVIEPKINPWKLSFPQKLEKIGALPENQASVIGKLNDIRNDYAHSLGFEFTFEKAFDYVCMASDAGLDFSDDSIYIDIETSRKYYETKDIVIEILNELFFILSDILQENGGPDRTAE